MIEHKMTMRSPQWAIAARKAVLARFDRTNHKVHVNGSSLHVIAATKVGRDNIVKFLEGFDCASRGHEGVTAAEYVASREVIATSEPAGDAYLDGILNRENR
jgi:hypothetical protein